MYGCCHRVGIAQLALFALFNQQGKQHLFKNFLSFVKSVFQVLLKFFLLTSPFIMLI